MDSYRTENSQWIRSRNLKENLSEIITPDHLYMFYRKSFANSSTVSSTKVLKDFLFEILRWYLKESFQFFQGIAVKIHSVILQRIAPEIPLMICFLRISISFTNSFNKYSNFLIGYLGAHPGISLGFPSGTPIWFFWESLDELSGKCLDGSLDIF